jgi:hypothetical protein
MVKKILLPLVLMLSMPMYPMGNSSLSDYQRAKNKANIACLALYGTMSIGLGFLIKSTLRSKQSLPNLFRPLPLLPLVQCPSQQQANDYQVINNQRQALNNQAQFVNNRSISRRADHSSRVNWMLGAEVTSLCLTTALAIAAGYELITDILKARKEKAAQNNQAGLNNGAR